MAEKKESKEVATQAAAGLPALPMLPNLGELQDVFESNFEGITPAFESIHIPTGGIAVWSVPGDGDEPDIEKEIQGVILDHYGVRVYWEQKYGGSGAGGPPDCSSIDGKTGNKFGACASCDFAKFGTATQADGTPGKGQACRMIHRVYIWMAGREGIFPYLLPLPPSSGQSKYDGSFQTYAIKLAGKMKKLQDVRTKVKLVAQDMNGVKVARAHFFYVADLTPGEKAQAAFLREQLRPAMRTKPMEFAEADEDTKIGAQSAQSAAANVGGWDSRAPGAEADPWESEHKD